MVFKLDRVSKVDHTQHCFSDMLFPVSPSLLTKPAQSLWEIVEKHVTGSAVEK